MNQHDRNANLDGIDIEMDMNWPIGRLNLSSRPSDLSYKPALSPCSPSCPSRRWSRWPPLSPSTQRWCQSRRVSCRSPPVGWRPRPPVRPPRYGRSWEVGDVVGPDAIERVKDVHEVVRHEAYEYSDKVHEQYPVQTFRPALITIVQSIPQYSKTHI